MNNARTASLTSIRQGLEVLFQAGQVIEVRVPGKFGSISGYFDDHDKLANAVKRLSDCGEYEGVYFTLNPCHRALLSRRKKNTLHRDVKTTTSDADILCRRLLLIDIDAKRPSGVSASKEELDEANRTAHAVRDWLREQGWPEPVIMFSGNGFHLLYRINLPNDKATTELLRDCLAALSVKFSTDEAQIDTAVYNAARITKAYGSLAAKGVNTAERPHRFSRLLLVPDPIDIVSQAKLEALVEIHRSAKNTTEVRSGETQVSREKIEEFLQWGGIAVKSTSESSDGTIKWVLKECEFNPEHADAAVFRLPSGPMVYKCFHASCQENKWAQFRSAVEERIGSRFTFSQRDGKRANADGAGRVKVNGTPSATQTPPWPPALANEAFLGLAGEIVRAIEPHSEADPAATLGQLLVAFGNAIGRHAHFRVEDDFHYANVFVALVGETSKARKGTSLGHIRKLFGEASPEWAADCVQSGMSSGEGLIHAVRDAVVRRKRARKTGGLANNEDDGLVEVEPGVIDKRLLVVEPEFAQPLKLMSREGNILSTVNRQAWDTGDLRTLTKNSPTRATGAHISIIGHITRPELLRHLGETEQANGFGNRFIWLAARRSKCLPEGGRVPDDEFDGLAARLAEAVHFARGVGEMTRSVRARTFWHQIYPALSEGKRGLYGALTARAEAQVLRVSMIYALLDLSSTILIQHIRAALALWKYAEDSVRYIFGDPLGDATADTILRELRNSPDGLTRTEVSNLFSRHLSTNEIGRALSILVEEGFARCERNQTEGRTQERWFAIEVPAEAKSVA